MIPAHQIGLGQKQFNSEAGAFGGEQKPTGLIRIETGLFDSEGHHHGGGIGHRGSAQQAASGLHPSHNGAALNAVDRLDNHPIADMHHFTPMAQTGASCAEQPRRNSFWSRVQLHLQIIRLQRHNNSGGIAHS